MVSDGAPTVQPAFDRTDVTGWSAFDVQGEDASWCQLTPTVPVDAGSGISPSRPVPVAGGRLPSRRRAVAGFDSCRPRRRACASHVGQRSPRHRVDHVEQVGRTIERLIPHLASIHRSGSGDRVLVEGGPGWESIAGSTRSGT